MSMSVDDVLTRLDGLTTAELGQVVDAATVLRGRRWAAQTAQDRAEAVQARAAVELAQIATQWHATHGGTGTVEDPVPWTQPTGAHDSWPPGSVVTHDDRVWRQDHHTVANWRPGAVGAPWTDITPPPAGGGPVAWAVGQTVKAGDERTHAGRLWRAKIDHVTHEGWVPSPAAHAVWEDLGPVP